jgi:regulator of sigma E protease
MRDFGLVMTMDPISAVQPDSPAKTAGLEPGDKILSIDGQPVGNPITLPDRMRRAAQDGKTINLEIQRKSEPKPLMLPITPRVPQSADELLPTNPMSAPALGIAYKVWTKVTAVNANTPAADAKLQPGDEIISAKYLAPPKKDVAAKDQDAGEPIDSTEPTKIEFDGKDPAWPYFVWEVLTFADPEAHWELEVRSGKETRKVELQTAEFKDEAGRMLHSQARGFLFQPLFTVHVADSFASAVRLGGRETLDNLLMVYRFLQKIGQKQISVKLLGGPVEIFRQAGRSAQQGWSDFLLFLTMLSANLAVINFLPIPVLDGGHMVFLAYELIRGKPASERVVVAFTYAGLIFILSLMMFVLALDTGLISRR